MKGTAAPGQRVVMVEVHSGTISVKTGRIAKTGSSHRRDGGRRMDVAWGDGRLSPAKDGPDEIYERSLRVDNIHLLTEREAHLLQDADTAHNWFGSIYQDRVVAKISRALRRLKGPAR